jgi:hypothetical protein
MQPNCAFWLAIAIILQSFVAGLTKKEKGKFAFLYQHACSYGIKFKENKVL